MILHNNCSADNADMKWTMMDNITDVGKFKQDNAIITIVTNYVVNLRWIEVALHNPSSIWFFY